MDANEAISAVVDEGFLGEEDDDYEDLYHDVNVGENVLQSLRKNEEVLPVAQESVVEEKAEINRASAQPLSGQEPEERKSERREEVVGSRGNGASGVEGFQINLAGRGTSGSEGGGLVRGELGHPPSRIGNVGEQIVGNNGQHLQGASQNHALNVGNAGHVGNMGNDTITRPVGGNMNDGNGNYGGGGGAGTILFVGDLHWWTTDAELEVELSKYGPIKEVKFFDERASGKSKGYCQVEFYDPAPATACKDGMNGHLFNGRPCVVAFASPFSVKKMGEAQVNRNQHISQTNTNHGRRAPGDAVGKPIGNNITTGANNQAGPDNNRGFGRGNWGRGGAQGMGGRGGGQMRNRGGGVGVRGIMGNGGNAFGQGFGATPPMMHNNPIMSQGFDPGFGPMGRMANYGGFPGAPNPPFPGMMSGFPPVGGVGFPGVAPHVNPAFFGRGMGMNGMGIMPNSGMDGPNMGMWPDPTSGGWTGDEHGGRVGESSYGEDAVSDHQYGESHDRGARQSGLKEKDRGSGSSERRFRDDREGGYERDTRREKDDHDWSERGPRDERDIPRDKERVRERSRDRERSRERDRHRDERDRYAEHHRHRERGSEYDDEFERGRSSRNHSKSRVSHDEERSRSRDADYGRRRV